MVWNTAMAGRRRCWTNRPRPSTSCASTTPASAAKSWSCSRSTTRPCGPDEKKCAGAEQKNATKIKRNQVLQNERGVGGCEGYEGKGGDKKTKTISGCCEVCGAASAVRIAGWSWLFASTSAARPDDPWWWWWRLWLGLRCRDAASASATPPGFLWRWPSASFFAWPPVRPPWKRAFGFLRRAICQYKRHYLRHPPSQSISCHFCSRIHWLLSLLRDVHSLDCFRYTGFRYVVWNLT